MPELSAAEWDEFLSKIPSTHILQSAGWGELKATFGWQVVRLATKLPPESTIDSPGCGAQILLRKLPLGFNLAYIPRGPVGQDWPGLLPELDRICLSKRVIFLKVEPDVWEDGSAAGTLQSPLEGFVTSAHSIQPARTMLIDLHGDETELLNRMKQKTRYNIRLAQKKGIVVCTSTDIPLFCHLLQETGARDHFGVHSQSYFQKVFDIFHPLGECELLFALLEDKPLAAIMVFAQGKRAWYFYGASTDRHRELMPTYLLQWEGIRWARRRGCIEYDLWGVPDHDTDFLEANFSHRADGLWGVYRFKRGFGGELRRTVGPWDKVYYPWLYRIYTWFLASRSVQA